MNEEHLETPKSQPQKLDPENRFHFHCGPGVSCYTQCCHDVSIAWTP